MFKSTPHGRHLYRTKIWTHDTCAGLWFSVGLSKPTGAFNAHTPFVFVIKRALNTFGSPFGFRNSQDTSYAEITEQEHMSCDWWPRPACVADVFVHVLAKQATCVGTLSMTTWAPASTVPPPPRGSNSGRSLLRASASPGLPRGLPPCCGRGPPFTFQSPRC